MIVLQVHMHVKPEFLEPFRAASIENATNTVLEPGCARFDFLQHQDDPNRFIFWEVYYSEDAIARHRLTPHYAKWVETVTDMLAEPRTRNIYTSVFPPDANW